VQLFQYLIANAIKFRSGPDRRIVVSAEAEDGCWRCGAPLRSLPANSKCDAISSILEAEFVEWLTREVKVAAIPVSAFYSQGTESGIVRFCFAKKDETLRLALDRLAKL
jgi:aspartate/methionine/tyrosine aminotransferase